MDDQIMRDIFGRLKTYQFQANLDNLREHFDNELGNAKGWDEFVEALKAVGFTDSYDPERQNKNEVYSCCIGMLDSIEHTINREDNIVTTSFYTIDLKLRRQKPKKYYDYPLDDDYDHGEIMQGDSGVEYSQADLDNHANQCNPNNDAYHSSRR